MGLHIGRYLACVMEVATPTEDCLMLIDDLLRPIIKARDENSLDRQEVNILQQIHHVRLGFECHILHLL